MKAKERKVLAKKMNSSPREREEGKRTEYWEGRLLRNVTGHKKEKKKWFGG